MAQGNFAKVNDLSLYYEVHGEGQPLVMIHGGLGLFGMFDPILPQLANRRVIGVDLQGHGHTADIDRAFSYEQMADDVAALIKFLGITQVDIYGYSLGGGVALQTLMRHPDLIRKTVLVSALFKSDGWFPEVRAGMKNLSADAAKTMIGSPMHQAYVNAAPQPENWATLVAKTGKLLMTEYDWTTSVASIQSPTMLFAGDADSIYPAHSVEFFQLLGGGQRDAGWDGSGMSNARLAILPHTTHYDIFSSPMLVPLINDFLND